MTDDTQTKEHAVADGGPGKASGEIRSDAAGKQRSPRGRGDLDQGAVDKSQEKLDQAGGGH